MSLHPLVRYRAAALVLACLLLGGGASTAYAVLDRPEPEPLIAEADRTRTGQGGQIGQAEQNGRAERTGQGAREDTSASGRPYVETRLFFGTVRPDGGPQVTRTQFDSFVTDEVTPRFPDGLTVQEGYGQYRDAQGVIERERSYEVILYYPAARDGRVDPAIEAVRSAYQKRFAQESVARVDDRIRLDF